MQAVDELRKEADKSNERSLAIVQKSLFQDAEGESLAVVSRQSSERRAAGRRVLVGHSCPTVIRRAEMPIVHGA